MDLPEPLGPTMPTRSPAATANDSPSCAGRRPPGYANVTRSKATVGARPASSTTRSARSRDRRLGVEEIEDALGRGDAEHPLVQEDPQLAQRAEDLDAQHQDDQQRGEVHLPRPHAIRAPSERHRGADGDAGVGDAAGQRVGPEHAHRAAEEGVALVREELGPRAALAEGLERAEPLDRIEELGAEGGSTPAGAPGCSGCRAGARRRARRA